MIRKLRRDHKINTLVFSRNNVCYLCDLKKITRDLQKTSKKGEKRSTSSTLFRTCVLENFAGSQRTVMMKTVNFLCMFLFVNYFYCTATTYLRAPLYLIR